MSFTSTDLVLIGLLLIIATQTSYTTYRQWRDGARSSGSNGGVLIDTSVLMDGRIVAIAETGFIPGKLVVPRSVVGELQFLADNADSEKRERARRGLDVINQLQALNGVDVEVLQDGSRAPNGVDERLLELAKKHGMKLCTIDFNLNKVAQVEDIIVLNVNELARNLRMSYLPGDSMTLDLATTGSDSHQAVGHLDDGTMVVVEQARSLIGTRQEVEVIRSLQTAAGKMMFARLAPSAKKSHSSQAATKKNAVATARKTSQRAAKKPAGTATKPVKSTRPATSSTQKKSTRSSAGGRRQKTNEDRLLDLVDRQA